MAGMADSVKHYFYFYLVVGFEELLGKSGTEKRKAKSGKAKNGKAKTGRFAVFGATCCHWLCFRGKAERGKAESEKRKSEKRKSDKFPPCRGSAGRARRRGPADSQGRKLRREEFESERENCVSEGAGLCIQGGEGFKGRSSKFHG